MDKIAFGSYAWIYAAMTLCLYMVGKPRTDAQFDRLIYLTSGALPSELE